MWSMCSFVMVDLGFHHVLWSFFLVYSLSFVLIWRVQERKEREAQAVEGGWTVVKHHKGRKKTTDSESGITVGSVAPAAVENQMTKKKPKEVGLEFYRFQKREAQRSGMMNLSKLVYCLFVQYAILTSYSNHEEIPDV